MSLTTAAQNTASRPVQLAGRITPVTQSIRSLAKLISPNWPLLVFILGGSGFELATALLRSSAFVATDAMTRWFGIAYICWFWVTLSWMLYGTTRRDGAARTRTRPSRSLADFCRRNLPGVPALRNQLGTFLAHGPAGKL